MAFGAAAGVGAAANIIGGVVQGIAASRAAEAMERAFEQQLAEQGRFRAQATSQFQGDLPQRGVETFREQQQAGRDRRNEAFEQVGQTRFGAGQEGPTERDQASARLMGDARANLGGFSDAALEQMIQTLQTQDKLNKISNFAGGEASIFPHQLAEAQHSEDKLAFIGKLVSSIGGGAQAFGAQGPGFSSGGGGQTQQFPALGGNFGLLGGLTR